MCGSLLFPNLNVRQERTSIFVLFKLHFLLLFTNNYCLERTVAKVRQSKHTKSVPQRKSMKKNPYKCRYIFFCFFKICSSTKICSSALLFRVQGTLKSRLNNIRTIEENHFEKKKNCIFLHYNCCTFCTIIVVLFIIFSSFLMISISLL